MIPIIIDTDPGIDDALALFYAFGSDKFDVRGITTVFGNVPVVTATRNALWLLDRLGRPDIPVSQGAALPLSAATPGFAAEVHGEGGFGRFETPAPAANATAKDAADLLIDLSHEYSGDLIVIALGPLTNLAIAANRDPTLPQRLKRIVVMGGAFTVAGNVTSAAEANIYNDPEAAFVVCQSYQRLDFIGLDVTDKIQLTQSDCEVLTQAASNPDGFIEEITSFYLYFYQSRSGVRCASLHDPSTLIAVSCPDLFAFKDTHLELPLSGHLRGATFPSKAGFSVRFAETANYTAVRDEFLRGALPVISGKF